MIHDRPHKLTWKIAKNEINFKEIIINDKNLETIYINSKNWEHFQIFSKKKNQNTKYVLLSN